jgi:hypothetical protein
MSELAEARTFAAEIRTLMSDSAGTFPDHPHQLQPLVLPQPSQT